MIGAEGWDDKQWLHKHHKNNNINRAKKKNNNSLVIQTWLDTGRQGCYAGSWWPKKKELKGERF